MGDPPSKFAPIPEIPGEVVHPEVAGHLQDHVGELTGSGNRQFPGSQPVSFNSSSIALLESKNFWVCEKSDGIRVLVLIAWNALKNEQDTFLLDRKNVYRQVSGLRFPHHDVREQWCKSTIFDAELVADRNPKTGVTTLRLYAFDCLVYDGQNLMRAGLQSRYGRLKSWLIEPFHRYLKANPDLKSTQPFEIVCKTMELGDAVEKVLYEHIPKLEHGHDGLIFTCAETGYVMGTDEMIMKWKPPSENTVDFKLVLRFPPMEGAGREDQPDMMAKPEFLLFTWLGKGRGRGGGGGPEEEFYDRMAVTDEEWERMKESGEQYDDRVVECFWDAEEDTFKFHRFRDDKEFGNHVSVVGKIMASIRDGVQLETLIAACPSIRARRKEREALVRAQRQQPMKTPGSQPQPHPQSQPPMGFQASDGYGLPQNLQAGAGGMLPPGGGQQSATPRLMR